MSTGRMWRMLGAAGLAGAGLLGVLAPGTAAVAAPTVTKNVSISSGGTGCAVFCFRPRGLKVVSGTTVKWTNNTGAPHTVTRCTPAACAGHSGGTGTDAGPASGTIGGGGTYSFTFQGKGTYLYYCQIHGFATMHGNITVR